MSDFKEGDVVQLKSGGPQMTIDTIDDYEGNGKLSASCTWFDNKKVENRVFHFHTLDKVS